MSTAREQFAVAPTIYSNPVHAPLGQEMHVDYTADAYRPIGSSPPPYSFVSAQSMNFSSGEQKRKRGRPRKYGADGGMSSGQQDINVPTSQSQTFSPPTALHPLKVQHDSQPLPLPSAKKARGRPPGSSNKKQRVAALGSTGFGFIPHVISVKAGEDVSSKIMAFSQNGPRAVCILSCSGAISNVTLCQAATSGGTATYEGQFDIMSLSGSYLLSEVAGQKSRTGGLRVTLAGPDGRVFGGCVAGLLIAATLVQVIVGSFVSDRKELKFAKYTGSSAPPKVNLGGIIGSSTSSSHGTQSEPSDGPASPLNLSSGGVYNNNNLQGMPWK